MRSPGPVRKSPQWRGPSDGVRGQPVVAAARGSARPEPAGGPPERRSKGGRAAVCPVSVPEPVTSPDSSSSTSKHVRSHRPNTLSKHGVRFPRIRHCHADDDCRWRARPAPPGLGGHHRAECRAAAIFAPTIATWLILPVVICLSQRLSHACLSTYFYIVKPRMAH